MSASSLALTFVVCALVVPTVAGTQIVPTSRTSAERSTDTEKPQKEKKPKGSKKSGKGGADTTRSAAPAAAGMVTATPFGEMNGRQPFNASGAVALDDGRFLLCDNKTPGALLELRLDASGRKVGGLVRRPLSGLGPEGVSDMEGMAAVELEGAKFVVATSSFGIRQGSGKKKSGGSGDSGAGLVRVDIGSDGSLTARKMTGVREWLVSHYPQLRASASLDPDSGGLNIEGLAWDPTRNALLFGLRTPLLGGKPVVLPVRITSASAPWTVEALEALPAVALTLDPSTGRGIRAIDYDPTGKVFWVSVGRAVSGGTAPFEMYLWDGNEAGTTRRLHNLTFHDAMKVEGVVACTVGGKAAVLLLDDGGGYRVVWADDPRVQ